MNRIMANAGQGNMRLMTDFSGARYWTLVAEFETPGMAEFEKMMQGEGMKEADTKEFERLACPSIGLSRNQLPPAASDPSLASIGRLTAEDVWR